MDDKVLLNVEINAKEALESYSKIKIRIDELRDSQKKLKESGQENSQVYHETEQQIKALSSRAQEYQKTIQQNVKLEHEQTGSLQQLKAQLSLWTQEYNKLGEAERNSDAGIQIAINISELTQKLTDAEIELGNFHRQVGNYALASQALKKEMKDLAAQLQVMKLNQEEGTAEYKKAIERLAELKDATADVAQEISGLSNDTKDLQIASQSIGLLSSSLGQMKSITEELNIGVPLLQESINKLNLVTTALSVATQFQTAAQKQSMVYQTAAQALQKIGIVQTQREAKALAAKTAMQTSSSIATKAATAATWLWNAALAANPVVLIAMAIAAAIVAVVAFTSAFSKSAKAQREAAEATKAYEEQERKTAATLDDIAARRSKQINDISNSMRQEIVAMKQRGATEEEIAKYKLKREQEIRDVELSSSRERQAANEELIKSKQNVIEKETEYLNTLRVGSKKYEEQKKKVDELNASLRDLQATQAEEIQKDNDILLQNIEAEQEAAEKRKQIRQKLASDQMALEKKIADDQLKALKDADELELEQSEASASVKFAHQQEWERKMFKANQDYEKRKLAQQKKDGKITEQEYKNSLASLSAAEQAFLTSQENALKKNMLSQFRSVIEQVGKQTKDMLADIDKNLADSTNSVKLQLGVDDSFINEYNNLASLMDMYAKQEEEFRKYGKVYQNATGATIEADRKRFEEMQEKMFEYTRIETELKRQAEQKKTAIEQSEVDKRLERVYKNIEDGTALDLLDFTKTEEEKTNIATRQSEMRIAALKKEAEAASDPQVKLELQKRIAQEENAIRENQLKNIQNGLNKELANAALSAQQKYNIKQEYLQKELEAVKGNAEAEEEVIRQMAEARSEYLNSVAESMSQWGGQAVQLASSISEAMSSVEQRELQEYEEANDAKKESLKARLDQGLISQEQYDKEVERMDKDLEKKKAEADLKAAKRQKAISIMEAAINTAAAIMKIWAEVPKEDFGASTIALTAVTAAIGAAQIAAISAQPLPKASRGALLHGPSHANGGIPIEAEGGEAIINKRATARYLPLLSAINESTGGVPLFAHGGVVQQTIRKTEANIDYSALAEAMAQVHLTPQVAVTDINRGQADMAVITQRKNY